MEFFMMASLKSHILLSIPAAPGDRFEGEFSELDGAKTVFLRKHGVGSGLLVVPE